MYIYIYIYANLPRIAIVRPAYPILGVEIARVKKPTCLAPSADKQTRNYDIESPPPITPPSLRKALELSHNKIK